MALPDILDIMLDAHVKMKSNRPAPDGSYYFFCPFCNDKEGHLNVVPGENVWRCPRCGEGGGVIYLIAKLNNVSFDEARNMAFHRDIKNETVAERKQILASAPEIDRYELASLEIRDKTYRTMLGLLSLETKHLDNLKKRGLTMSAIKKRQYKSTPTQYNKEIPKKLIEMGCTLVGVPGFFEKNGEWTMFSCVPGYFIPFITVDGFMSGLQIRNDLPTDSKRKYWWFSTPGFHHGAKMKSSPHIISYDGQDTICLTEGALKADVAAFLEYYLFKEKIAFMGIAGASNLIAIKDTLLQLKAKGVKRIIEMLDMDKLGNKDAEYNDNIKKAQQKIIEIIKECGLECETATWETGKGIDDCLHALQIQTQKEKRSKE